MNVKYFLILILLSLKGFTQNNYGDILHSFKSYNIIELNYFFNDSATNLNTNNLFLFRWKYLKFNELDKELLFNYKCVNNKEKAIKNLYIGDYYEFSKKQNDSLSYKHYLKAFNNAKQIKDTLLINESLIRIAKHHFDYHEFNFDLLKQTVLELKSYQKDLIDKFWISYFDIVQILVKHEHEKTKPNINNSVFKNSKIIANKNPFLLAWLYQLEGIYYNHYLNDYRKAKVCFDNAILNYQKLDLEVIKERIYGNKINGTICLFNQKKYNQAIRNFKIELKSDFNINNNYNKIILNEWIYKCYNELKKPDSVSFYLQEMNTIKENTKEIEFAKSIKKHSIKYNNDRLIFELENETQKTNSLNQKMNTILPILGIITLLLAIVFLLYKKHQKKSSTLEEEKSETIKKIDELKQIVIKNHIILKDKTKVYIADLLYIKSDDHYLKVYLSNGKNHFVRGRLNKIIEELPPNFIRCHRSYVVNRNFIKQINNNNIILVDKTEIPLSRTFKDNL